MPAGFPIALLQQAPLGRSRCASRQRYRSCVLLHRPAACFWLGLQRWFLLPRRQGQSDDVRGCRRFNKPSTSVIAQLDTTRVGRLLGVYAHDVMINATVNAMMEQRTHHERWGVLKADASRGFSTARRFQGQLDAVCRRTLTRSFSPPAKNLGGCCAYKLGVPTQATPTPVLPG